MTTRVQQPNITSDLVNMTTQQPTNTNHLQMNKRHHSKQTNTTTQHYYHYTSYKIAAKSKTNKHYQFTQSLKPYDTIHKLAAQFKTNKHYQTTQSPKPYDTTTQHVMAIKLQDTQHLLAFGIQ